MQNFNILASLYIWAAWLKPYIVWNPGDQFSRVKDYTFQTIVSQ